MLRRLHISGTSLGSRPTPEAVLSYPQSRIPESYAELRLHCANPVARHGKLRVAGIL